MWYSNMASKKNNLRSGFTLIELMVTVIAAIIVLIGISTMIAAGHRNFNTMYRRTTSDVVRNAYEARIIFDRIVRKSVFERADLASSENLVVYYYSDPANMSLSVFPDRYAMFYKDGSVLRLQEGNCNWPPS